MLSRYHDPAAVWRLPAAEGAALLFYAAEERQRDRWHRQWAAQLPFMGKDNYISFAEYCDRLSGANIDTRPTAVILAELDEMERQMEEDATHGA